MAKIVDISSKVRGTPETLRRRVENPATQGSTQTVKDSFVGEAQTRQVSTQKLTTGELILGFGETVDDMKQNGMLPKDFEKQMAQMEAMIKSGELKW